MKLIVHTQNRENYGAHNWDGKSACPQQWKNKGGDAIVLADLTVQQAIDIAAAGNMGKLVLDRIEAMNIVESNESFEVDVIGWELVEDGDIKIVWDHNDPNRYGASKVTDLMQTRDDLDYQGPIVQQMAGRRRHGYYFAKVS